MAEVNWYPGHMAKTMRLLREQLGACEFILELCDARIPESSRNPELDRLLQHKNRLLLLNKADLADEAATAAWLNFYRAQGVEAMASDARKAADVARVEKKILELNSERIARARERGRQQRPIRCLVAGIPNCGKSSLINRFCKKNSAKTANIPGVTRSLSWLRAGSSLLLLDSPGLLWPKLETRREQIHLAACAAIRDDILPIEELGGELLLELALLAAPSLKERYRIDPEQIRREVGESVGEASYRVLEKFALERGIVRQGGLSDRPKAATLLLNDFRQGALGRVSLETAENSKDAKERPLNDEK